MYYERSLVTAVTFSFLLMTILSIVSTARGSIRQTGSFEPGKVTEQVVSISDTSQSYALYLPTTYSDIKEWPVLIVMDPRGRALLGMELFQEAAEAFGYLVISSYNTQSDGPEQPNVDALNAMINDAFTLFSVDKRRLYLVGFSGTARLAWPYGYQLKNHVAGVIGFGAGPSPNFLLEVAVKLHGKPFAFYGGSGVFDFNYMELLQYEKRLKAAEFPHHLQFYPGPHNWPTKDICRDAVAWMEIQAMKKNLNKPDTRFLNAYLNTWIARADSLRNSGYLYDSARIYDSLLKNFSGLTELQAVRQKSRRLKRKRSFRNASEEVERAIDIYLEGKEQFGNFLSDVEGSEDYPAAEEMAARLNITEMKAKIENNDQIYLSRSYRGILESMYVSVSFYQPRKLLDEHQWNKALTMVELADLIKPGHPRNCLQFARIYTQLKRYEEAMGALRCIEDSGWLSVDYLRNDPWLQYLWQIPRFKTFLDSLDIKQK